MTALACGLEGAAPLSLLRLRAALPDVVPRSTRTTARDGTLAARPGEDGDCAGCHARLEAEQRAA
jgi:hypothetical protein